MLFLAMAPVKVGADTAAPAPGADVVVAGLHGPAGGCGYQPSPVSVPDGTAWVETAALVDPVACSFAVHVSYVPAAVSIPTPAPPDLGCMSSTCSATDCIDYCARDNTFFQTEVDLCPEYGTLHMCNAFQGTCNEDCLTAIEINPYTYLGGLSCPQPSTTGALGWLGWASGFEVNTETASHQDGCYSSSKEWTTGSQHTVFIARGPQAGICFGLVATLDAHATTAWDNASGNSTSSPGGGTVFANGPLECLSQLVFQYYGQ